jgi:uncharacterized protein (DUF2252 family)
LIDVVKAVRRFNAGRDPERLAMKYAAMAASPFVFLRGTCHLFYRQLPDARVLARAPLAWVCGDLHLENFGSYRADNGLTYFDINDFDEGALAPATWDLVRFLASVLCAGSELGLKRAEARRMCAQFSQSYAQALAEGRMRWVERETATGPIKELFDELRDRKRVDFLDDRTERDGKRGRRLHIDGKRALQVGDKTQARVAKLVARFAKSRDDADFFEVLDVARRIAGTGSLGVERYVVLVRGKATEGKSDGDGNHLLDLKLALPSSLGAPLRTRLGLRQPAWAGESARCVALQGRMQAVPAAMLHRLDAGGRGYVLRSLLPSQDRISLDPKHTDLDELRGVLVEMGRLVASAHLRASGRQGSANADALIRFGSRYKTWIGPLQEAAETCAAQVRDDWKVWAAAVRDKGEAALAGRRKAA